MIETALSYAAGLMAGATIMYCLLSYNGARHWPWWAWALIICTLIATASYEWIKNFLT